MAQITIKGNPVNTYGNLPGKGSKAPNFSLVKTDLSEVKLSDYLGKKVVLNIFTSLDTSTCAASVRRFNKEAQALDNTVVLCISLDLPFAHNRFCTSEGLDKVVNVSAFRNPEFGKDYGVIFVDGPLKGLFSRSVVIVNEKGEVVYSQQVPENTIEPDYESALAAL